MMMMMMEVEGVGIEEWRLTDVRDSSEVVQCVENSCRSLHIDDGEEKCGYFRPPANEILSEWTLS